MTGSSADQPPCGTNGAFVASEATNAPFVSGEGLTDPMAIGARTAPSRVLFGPHVTNLARGRTLSEDHVGYYGARAAGGAGVIVTEVASVHDSDHPYERAPRASDCEPGWSAVVAACRPHGALVVAGLGHAGGEGSSAHHRRALWGASPTPDPASGEVPSVIGPAQVEALVAGFAAAASTAVLAGCDGVEIQAGGHALLRQFLSRLTGPGSVAPLAAVLAAVREAVGPGVVVGLRLAVDEGAPWAGITPDDGVPTASRLTADVDYLVPVRGSALASGRPDAHTAPAFLRATCERVRSVAACPVVLAGSVVDVGDARAALHDGVADLVEMTRAQIADPTLVARTRAGHTPRPCVLTNQECRVRDVRNPRVSCTVEPGPIGPPPRGSDEPFLPRDASDEPFLPRGGLRRTGVLVVGGGPAGLEGARTLALAGHRVRLVERSDRLGGLLPDIAALPGRHRFARLADWLVDEVRALGVAVDLGTEVTTWPDGPVLDATGAGPSPVLAALADPPPGPVVIDDPLGDGAAVALAEWLAARGRSVALVTGDPVAGKQLARTGDLVDANGRLQRAGVRRVLESTVVTVREGSVLVADVITGETTELSCASFLDAGPRAATAHHGRHGVEIVGDAVAPRTVGEAIREGRAAALRLAGVR